MPLWRSLPKKDGDHYIKVGAQQNHHHHNKMNTVCLLFSLSIRLHLTLKGFAIVASFTIPAHALYFWGYESCKRALRPSVPLDQKGPLVHFVSGVFADVMGSFVWVPQVTIADSQCIMCNANYHSWYLLNSLISLLFVKDVVKQRLQVQRNSMKSGSTTEAKYRGSAHAIRTIIKEEGVAALWTVYFIKKPNAFLWCLLVFTYAILSCFFSSKGFLPSTDSVLSICGYLFHDIWTNKNRLPKDLWVLFWRRFASAISTRCTQKHLSSNFSAYTEFNPISFHHHHQQQQLGEQPLVPLQLQSHLLWMS